MTWKVLNDDKLINDGISEIPEYISINIQRYTPNFQILWLLLIFHDWFE